MAMHKLLVYQDHPRRGRVIHFCECPPTHHRDAGNLEVIGGHNNIECAEPLVGRQFRLALDSESDAARPGCRQVGSSGDGVGAWNVLEAGNQIPNEEASLRGILVSCLVKGHAGGKEMVCAEAEILMLNQENAAD